MVTDRIRVAVSGPVEELEPVLNRLLEIRGECPFDLLSVATPDQRASALRTLLEDWGGNIPVRLRVQDVLSNDPVDAFILASPLVKRHADAQKALYSGCHVLVKAPLALTVKAGRNAIRAAEENERLLSVYDSNCFSKQAQILRWVVSSSVIGKLAFVCDTSFGEEGLSPNLCYRNEPKHHQRIHGGGLLLCKVVGDMALLRFACGDVVDLFGRDLSVERERVIRREDGAIGQRFACSADDTVGAHLRFTNNAGGQYLRSWSGWGKVFERRFGIWGTRGSMQDGQLFMPSRQPVDVEAAWKDAMGPAELERLFPGSTTDPIQLELMGFLKGVESFGEKKGVHGVHTGREALRDLATAWAASEAWKAGKRLKVSEVENLQVEEAQKPLNERWRIS